MAHLVFIGGDSGSGKSTSERNLDPEKSVIINTDQKALPFKKFKEKFNEEKKNYRKTSDINKVMATLKKVNDEMTHVTTVVIDTWSRIMTDFIMAPQFRASKGFDKWTKMSGSQYDLINYINNDMREDINVYLLCHLEDHQDESGFTSKRIVVQGKQLKNFVPESFSSIVLYCEVQKSPGQPNKHVFRVINSGADTCKTPIGMFEDEEGNPLEFIDNDITLVNKAIAEYY